MNINFQGNPRAEKNKNNKMLNAQDAARIVKEQGKSRHSSPVQTVIVDQGSEKTYTFNMPKRSLWDKTKDMGRKVIGGTAVAAQVASPTIGLVQQGKVAGSALAIGSIMSSLQSCNISQDVEIDLNPLMQQIEEFIKKYEDGNKAILNSLALLSKLIEANGGKLDNIQGALDQVNLNFKDLNALVQELVEQGKSSEEILNKVLLELTRITQNLAMLAEIRDAIKELDKNQDKRTEKIIEAYEKGQAGIMETLNSLYTVLKSIEGLSSEQIKQLESIKDKMDTIGSGDINVNIDGSKLLQEMLDLLKNIDKNLGTLLDGFTKYAETMIQKQDKTNEQLDNIFNGIGDVNTKLDALKLSVDQTTEAVNNMSATVTAMGDSFKRVEEKLDKTNATLGDYFNYAKEHDQMTDADRKEMLEIMRKLGIKADESITLDQLENLFAKYQTNLTTTNALLQNITTLVEQVVQKLNQGFSIDLTEVKNLLSQINQSGTDNLEQTKALQELLKQKLEEILGGLGDIGDKLDQLIEQAKTANAALAKANENFEKYAGRTLDYMDTSLALAKENAKKTEAYYVASLQAKADILEAIKGIVVDNGGSQKLDELLALFKDFPEVVQILRDLKSSQITIKEINDALANIDLNINMTTTNALLQNAVTLLEFIAQNAGKPSGSVDITELKSLLSSVLTAITDGNTNLDEKMDALNNAVKDVEAAIKAQGGNVNLAKADTKSTSSEVKLLAQVLEKLRKSQNNIAQLKLMGAQTSTQGANEVLKTSSDDTYFWRV